MPINQDIYCGSCEFCDWEYWCKSAQAENMMKRLHKKKCKKTGRTKEPEWRARLLAERAVFQDTISNIKTLRKGKGKKDVEFVDARRAKQALEDGKICCFPHCLNHIGEYGHNADPVMPFPARCCEQCNFTEVIPGRMALSQRS